MFNPLASLSPGFSIEVFGQDVGDAVSALVKRVEFESCDGIADMAKITLANPDFVLTDKRIFQPGNEVSIWMGYENNFEHIGRVVIVRATPNFPQSQQPELHIEGYSKDYQMMDNMPEGAQPAGGKGGRVYTEYRYSDVIALKGADYDMLPDIDDTPIVKSFVHAKDLSDYEFVKGIANLTGFYFWVDADEKGNWTLHFRDPEKTIVQDKQYTFYYNQGDDSSLLSFTPEFAIKGEATKLRVQVKNPYTGELIDEEVDAQDELYDDEYRGVPDEEVLGTIVSGTAVKVFMGDFSVRVIPTKRLQTSAEAKAWVQQWFRRMRENFISAHGLVIGNEKLRARQTHALSGLGTAYDGDYYLTTVRHIIDNERGYLCDFNARKVIQ